MWDCGSGTQIAKLKFDAVINKCALGRCSRLPPPVHHDVSKRLNILICNRVFFAYLMISLIDELQSETENCLLLIALENGHLVGIDVDAFQPVFEIEQSSAVNAVIFLNDGFACGMEDGTVAYYRDVAALTRFVYVNLLFELRRTTSF